MKANNITLHHVELKRIFIYLAIVFGVYYGLWFIAVILPSNAGKGIYSLLSFPAVFMGTPAFAVFITRKITSDKSPLKFSAKVWKNKKALLFSAFVPTAAIFCGTAIFFLIFPNDLDFSGKYISQTYGAFGAPSDISFTVFSMLRMGTIVYIISAVCFPVWFIALGEDIGWQGYLLPLLCKRFPVRCAVLLNGALWGMAHAPLIYFGMNYGDDYIGAPISGIAMMVLVCVVLGIWSSYVTLKYNNCMYAAIIHGASDIIGEAGVWISLSTKSTLLGPNPTGIIGMSVLILGASILLVRLPNGKLH
ncbi:MAG: CPBP family intramembrane metalloprotease [Lachnospiraceae bacterium]|nr:CPBP family intramembrane metalloprotease [Lachnospiraceae bacterium]